MSSDEDLSTPISEFIHVLERKTWKLQWGELVNDTLYLYSSKQDRLQKSIPNCIMNVKNLNVQPVDVDGVDCDGLAFQLRDNGDVNLAMKPLNILDLGRWISSLFMAIKGRETSVTRVTQRTRTDSFTEVQEDLEEDVSYPDVKNIAKQFEKLAAAEADVIPKRLIRSQSTPNLRAEAESVALPEEIQDAPMMKSRGHRQRPQSTSEMSDQSLFEVDSSTTSSVIAEKENKEADIIKCSAGPYRALDADVLRTMVNPFLAKRRLTKQEQQIRKLEKTIDDVIKRIERQKNLMTETRDILVDLQDKASDTVEREQVIGLENECFHLQMQIEKSEESVNDYRALIQQIEDDMIAQQKSDEIEEQEMAEKERFETGMLRDLMKFDELTNENDEMEQLQHLQESGNGLQRSPSESDSDEDLRHPEMNKDTPEWAKQACMKSKRAYRILAKEGIL